MLIFYNFYRTLDLLLLCKNILCDRIISARPLNTLYIEKTMIVHLISALSGEIRNSIGMARLAEPVQCVSGQA